MMTKFKQALKSWFIPGTENDHKPHILRNKTMLIFAIVVLCLKLSILGLFIYFPNSAYFSAITTNSLTDLMNQSREENGLSTLVVNEKLVRSAYLKAQDILDNGYFSHTSPQGLTPWHWFKQAGYNYRYAGENLAVDFVDAEGLHEALLNSPTHKANLLHGDYKEVGIAVVTGDFNGKKTTIAVQHFGTEFEKTAVVVEPPVISPTFAELEEKNLASERSVEEIEKDSEMTPVERIPIVVEEKIKEFEKFAADAQIKQGPKILGTLVQKSGEITQSVYIYALLFVGLALLLNIFVKFEVQHRGLVINCLLIVVLLILLILIGDKSLLSTNLNII